jgi:predicted RNA-binding Zn-ribbon protein involved in translation (DUF1610 family)
MSDLIKRSDAINSIYKLKKTVIKHDVLSYHDGLFDALEIVQNLPSADRPRGEWIEHKGRTIVGDNNFIDFFPTEYECSNCGLRQATYFINSKLPNFCPNCGADMRKETVDYKSVVLICDEEGNWSMHGERKENE